MQLREECSECGLREMCLPAGLTREELARLEELVSSHRKFPLGSSLYEMHDPFKFIYAVWTGFFKSSLTLEDGRDQVTGFHMPGDFVGLDGIEIERHTCNAVALEDSQVCVIPFASLADIVRAVPAMQREFHRLLSREIVRNQNVMLMLGNMTAEQRLASFLLDLSRRYAARGYSRSELHLRMKRSEIGSFLGMKIETVSRTFSMFQSEGLIHVSQRNVRILDAAGLTALIAQDE